jgi:hypothetical protein
MFVVAIVELGEIAVQMLAGNVVVHAHDAALRMLKCPSTVFVCQNWARTYSSALWLTVP